MCAKNTAQSLKWITRLQTDSERTAQPRHPLHRNAKMYSKHVLPRVRFSQNNVSKHFVVCHASPESLAAQTLVEIKAPMYQVGSNIIREDYDPFVILLCVNSIAISILVLSLQLRKK